MAKRSVLDEIQIAALSAAIELVKNPEYSREWLKKEFAEREIKSVRMTDDILDAVEVTMVNQLDQIAAVLKLQLEAAIERADAGDDYESPTMKLVKNILDHSQDPDDTLQLEAVEVEPEFYGGDIPIVDYISLIHDDSKTSETSGVLTMGSKIARANKAAKEQKDVLAEAAAFTQMCVEAVISEEFAKGNKVTYSEALEILRKRMVIGLRETD